MRFVIDGDVVRRYIEKCTPDVKDKGILWQLGLADAMAVQEALFSFFDEALVTSVQPSNASSS
jgi:hypothetical protein